MKQLIECVPNFSEGRDLSIIKQITNEIESVEGIKLLDVDPGKATNRTVVTFVGEPEAVIEAAFRGAKKAQEVIDMTKHSGEHPRFGALDVCPLIPVANISMEETAAYAKKLGEKIGNELQYPVFLYESSAAKPERRNLANVRSGEYEGLEKKLTNPNWKPDFGPVSFVPRSGATAVGARDFLIAVNFNLNTTSVRRANSVAFDVREAGRVLRKGDPVTGEVILDEKGDQVRIPGKLKGCKAIGWYIEEYGIAQISMNITKISDTPLHIAFEEVRKSADERGMRVSGTEIVGLVPLKVLIDAGKYFLTKQQRSIGVSEKELVKIAIKSMGLDDLRPFDPGKKVIEYLLNESASGTLINKSLREFSEETASESPAPGGGSVSAYVGALGVSLGAMVANLSSHKRGWDDQWDYFSQWAEKAQHIKDQLLWLVDEDTRAFSEIMKAFGMPKTSDQEISARKKAIDEATKYAIEIPFKVMETTYASFEMLKDMAEKGNPNSVSDAGVGAICCLAAMKGAYLNVKINSGGYSDKGFTGEILRKADQLIESAIKKENEVYEITLKTMS